MINLIGNILRSIYATGDKETPLLKLVERMTNSTYDKNCSCSLSCTDVKNLFKHVRVVQCDNLVLLRYNQESLDELYSGEFCHILREMRSIVIDIDDFTVALLPFTKFFNLNEIPETGHGAIMRRIKEAGKFTIYNKLDGSMISASYHKCKVLLATSGSIDRNKSIVLNSAYNLLTKEQEDMIKSYPNYTFIFEHISKSDPHIVVYDFEGLSLIGVRNKINGRLVDHSQFTKEDVKVIRSNLEQSFNVLVCSASRHPADVSEGFVVDVGSKLIKIKNSNYVSANKFYKRTNVTNDLLKMYYDGTYDDILSYLPTRSKQELAKSVDEIKSFCNTKLDFLLSVVKTKANTKIPRKEVAKGVKDVPSSIIKLFWRAYELKTGYYVLGEIDLSLKDMLLKNQEVITVKEMYRQLEEINKYKEDNK